MEENLISRAMKFIQEKFGSMASPLPDEPDIRKEFYPKPSSQVITPTPPFGPQTIKTARQEASKEPPEIDSKLLKILATTESSNDPNAVSPMGAKGKFQFTDDTIQTLANMGFNNGELFDPYDPVISEKAATFYLEHLLARFGSLPLALAAYNAGPGAVEKFGDIPPYEETQNYVKKILEQLE